MKENRKKTVVFVQFLCLLAALLMVAPGARSQNGIKKEITIAFNQGEKMDAALKRLETVSELTFGYDATAIGRYTAPQLKFENQPVDSILKALLKETNLSYNAVNGYVVVKVQAPGAVTGNVIDAESGQPVPDVTVRIGNKGTMSASDGSFHLSLPPGTYQAEISSVGYGKKVVTDVVVKENETFVLNVTLKRQKGQLAAFTVQASARKESIASLFTRQKNAATLSDGISAEQIRATPDKHIGETLKRITGVSTKDNRKVVVRGIAERYNVTLLDGSALPSTDVQDRDFEFDLIPTNLVDNVVVVKSITPDMPYGFAGGLVQINTKAIPASDFTSVSAGLSINTRTMGKDFYSYGRGKYDYLGYDDGGRDHFPDGVISLSDAFNPRMPDDQNTVTAAQVGEQNKRIGGTERLGARIFQPMPSQNYQFNLGRAYSLSEAKLRRIGFVGSLTYRNTQSNDHISEMRRGGWSRQRTDPYDATDVNTGNIYGFNTTIGMLLNGGFKTDKHQISTYNLYTHIFNDRFSRIKGWSHENPKDNYVNKFPDIEEDDRPKFVDLIQNKLSGSHRFDPLKIEWNLARTHLSSVEKDAVSAFIAGREVANKAPLYEYLPGTATDPGQGNLHRDRYIYKERNLSADVSAAIDFRLGKTSHTFKTGFNFLEKHAWYYWNVLPLVTLAGLQSNLPTIPIQEWGNYMSMENPRTDLFYYPANYSLDNFEGTSVNKGAYAMFDNKILPNLRLVWGLRADYFRLDTIRNSASRREDLTRKVIFDEAKDWYFLPSANLTYTPVTNLNVRLSYGESIVRPGLMENSKFSRYNPSYGTIMRSNGVTSTLVKNYDAKLEWFPGAGEIISAGYFYKYFDKPAEYYAEDPENTGRYYIIVTNSDWAKVRGWEFELRKSLGFLYPAWNFLQDIYVSGNLTLQESQVRARNRLVHQLPDGTDSLSYAYMRYPRSLYGQVPLIYNIGLQYRGERLGMNIVYNYMGYKTFITGADPNMIEYERPRAQLDAQITYRFFSGKMEAKLNLGNLLDMPFRFFINDHTTYEYKPGMEDAKNWPENAEWADAFRYKWGFSEKFEEGYIGRINENMPEQRIGDRQTFTRYTGRSFSLSLSYNF